MNILTKIIGSFVLVFSLSLPAWAAPIKTDFVFIIDATSSMGGEINGVRNGFSNFVGGLNAASVDARFAIILFGGASELVLDFTNDQTATQTAFNNITIGANAGFQNNHNVNPEAGLEAIRIALGAAPNSTLARNNVGGIGGLDFRDDARKNLILATDEDSDCPFYAANDLGSCIGAGNNNSLLVQEEVDAAAQAVIDANAFLNMLINVNDSPSASQYGDYNKDVSDADLLNFDADLTLAALLADTTTDNSLQAQVLGAGLLARTFNIAGANDENFVNNFFSAKIEEVVQDDPCLIDPNLPQCNGTVSVPEPGILALFGLGLAGLGFARRKKA